MSSKSKLQMPEFKSEREEARWYAAHPEYFTQKFDQAKKEGRLKRLSEIDWQQVKREARQLPGPSPTITIRLQQEDIDLAKRLAERKGLRYQTYLKMVIHQVLQQEEAQTSP